MTLQSHEVKALAIELAAAMPPAEPVAASSSMPAHAHTVLSVDAVDELHELILQARGIVDILGKVDPDDLENDSLRHVAWAVGRMLKDVKRVIDAGSIKA